MTPTLAYRDGWLAHSHARAEADNPYHPELQAASHADWLRGHRDRAGKEPGAYLTGVLDVMVAEG